jgi:hypothetical protein
MKTYQWHDKEKKPAIVAECMANVCASVSGDDSVVVIPPDRNGYELSSKDPRCASDELRCILLAADPAGRWMDTDSEQIKPYTPPDDGKPYFSQGIPGWANGDVIIANGNSQVFLDLLEIFKTVPQVPGWMQRALNKEMKDSIGLIPDGYFRHFSLCHARHLTEGQSMGTRVAVLTRKNGEIIVAQRL